MSKKFSSYVIFCSGPAKAEGWQLFAPGTTWYSVPSHCYFDYGYSQISLEKTYSFELVSEGLSPEQSAHILGVQANMWTPALKHQDER